MSHDTDTGSTRALLAVILLLISIFGVALCAVPR